MGTDTAIRAEGLRKRYGGKAALDLQVPAGTLCGLLGPNGAGKTTAVRILTTLQRLDEGTAEVAGLDVARRPADVKRRIGLLGQQTAVDFGLADTGNKPAAAYSGGMRRRLELAAALISPGTPSRWPCSGRCSSPRCSCRYQGLGR